MSYCRIGEGSDVYVIRHVNGMLVCYCCLPDNEHDGPEGMITHLIDHRQLGHEVPQRALDRLNAERLHLPFKTDVEQALEDFWPGLTAQRDGQVES